jgi:prephenate dehydrogenase
MRIAIAGLGLVGGSLARALSALGHQVVGVDRRLAAARARRAGAIAEIGGSIETAAEHAQVVVLAAPPRANVVLLERLARVAKPGLVVTDVGSVKAEICRVAKRLSVGGFVGGHPMAGNAGRGFGASNASLFRGRPWILTGGSPAAVARVRRIVRAVGAKPSSMSPQAHDRTVAFLSHVPQVVAWGLLGAASRDRVARRHLALSGPGFEDMTRLAGSPRALWDEILAGNQREVARALAAFLKELRA